MLKYLPNHHKRLIANGQVCATGEVVAIQVPESLMPVNP